MLQIGMREYIERARLFELIELAPSIYTILICIIGLPKRPSSLPPPSFQIIFSSRQSQYAEAVTCSVASGTATTVVRRPHRFLTDISLVEKHAMLISNTLIDAYASFRLLPFFDEIIYSGPLEISNFFLRHMMPLLTTGPESDDAASSLAARRRYRPLSTKSPISARSMSPLSRRSMQHRLMFTYRAQHIDDYFDGLLFRLTHAKI